jgi:hypothetical protein
MADKMMQSAGRSIASSVGRQLKQFAAAGILEDCSVAADAPCHGCPGSGARLARCADRQDEAALKRLIHPQFKLVGIRSTGSVAVNLEQWIEALSGWTSPA